MPSSVQKSAPPGEVRTTTARVVARGAIWNYSAQVGTVLAQLAYAAVTSRLLDAHFFGVLAAAMASTALINLLALAGLPQIVGRMTDLAGARLLGLLCYAGIVGVAALTATLISSEVWASIWGVPEAAELVRLLSVTSFFTPLVALGQGLFIRLGRFRDLAATTVVANATGMAIGVAAVAVFRAAPALAVSQILAQVIIAGTTLLLLRNRFGGRIDIRATLTDVRYSAKSVTAGTISYFAGTIGKLTATQGFGTATLGNWNRADAITTTPFYQLGAALGQAVYPEFRHDLDSRERTKRAWSDLLGIAAWVCVPLGALVAVVAPAAVTLLLGDGWAEAARMAPILATIGSLQPVVFLLVNGFEALGKFTWIWAGLLISLAVNVGAAWAAIQLGSIDAIFAGTLISFGVMHSLHLLLAARAGLVDLRKVGVHYLQVTVFTLGFAAVVWPFFNVTASWALSPWLLLTASVLVLVGSGLLWYYRESFPPIRLARAYGILNR